MMNNKAVNIFYNEKIEIFNLSRNNNAKLPIELKIYIDYYTTWIKNIVFIRITEFYRISKLNNNVKLTLYKFILFSVLMKCIIMDFKIWT